MTEENCSSPEWGNLPQCHFVRLGSNAGLRGDSLGHGTARDSSNRWQKKSCRY